MGSRWWFARLWGRLPPKSRFYARTAGYRSERGSMWKWRTIGLLPLALLVGFGVLLGYQPDESACTRARPCPGTRGWDQPFRGVANVVAHPAVALPVAFFLLVWFAWCLRRATLARLTWRGAGIVVPEFKEGSELNGYRPAHLTARFRERLALLRLESASPAPGAAAEGTFVDVIGAPDAKGGDIIGPLLRLLRAAAPTHSIELQGVARQREEDPGFGITVQVIQVPSQPSPMIEVWESTWERAIMRAADEATSAIMPRSRLCRGPWAGWRGYVMPSGLVNAYEEAAKLEQEARYDEAMGRYRDALALDPTNVTLRLRLGQLEEKVGLFLGALVSYLEILAFERPGGRTMPRGVYRRSARLEWERAVVLAKYRAIILLGQGSIVEQWNEVEGVAEKIVNRDKLQEYLGARLGPLAGARPVDPAADATRGDAAAEVIPVDAPPDADRGDPAAAKIRAGVRALLQKPERLSADQAREKQGELAKKAEEAAEALQRSLSPVRWRPRDKPLTRRSVALGRECIALRAELMKGKTPSLECLHARVERSGGGLGWRPWRGRSVWHEHYNAACLYAIRLIENDRGERLGEKARSEVARAAVDRLELAVRTRDAEFVANWRAWVVSADSDLASLRREKEFRAFEAMYFPAYNVSREADRSHPKDPHRLAECRYTRDLLAEVADCRHHAWHARGGRVGRSPGLDPHALRQWAKEEQDLLERVFEVADRQYDWRARLALLQLANKFTDKAPIKVQFRLYPEKPIEDAEVERERERAHKRMGRLAVYLGPEPHSKSWWCAMRDHDPHPATPGRDVRALCEAHALMWQEFADWVRSDKDVGGKHFQTALAALVRHWGPWRPRTPMTGPTRAPAARPSARPSSWTSSG